MTTAARRLAVVGAGWAGLAAAVRATQAGWSVQLFDMAPQAGGRARSLARGAQEQDNGQHILIGAYAQTLELMRTVGVDLEQVLTRLPLALVDAQGEGLRLKPGPALWRLAQAVLAHTRWSMGDRLRLLAHATGWALGGFRCEPDRPVADWARGLPAAVQRDLIDPLCVAALNTPSRDASAAVFLRVLRDGLFSGAGGSDLLLPRRPLGELLPQPALRWLESQGAQIHLRQRVQTLAAHGVSWQLDGGEPVDAVILACSAAEAARLARPHAPAWADAAAAFGYEPIVTAWLQAPGARLPHPMIALRGEPAQFAFDLQALGHPQGGISLVVSGARKWVDAGEERLQQALLAQIRSELGAHVPPDFRMDGCITEKRATFRCVPGLQRPAARLAPGLMAAGDYVDGPYPATLEGAVRAGEAAVQALGAGARGLAA